MNTDSADALDALRIVLDPVGQAGVAIALMLIMFGVALGLRIADFRDLMRTPAVFAAGVLAQVLLLPLITYLLVLAIQPPASIALGMIVVACCPGGSVSNLLTYYARGDLALSVSLTATSSFMAALLTPVSALFWSSVYGPTAELLLELQIDPLAFILQTTILLALPLVAGMWVAANWPDIAASIRARMTLAGTSVLVATIAYGVVLFFPLLWPAVAMLAGVTILHNAVAFATGAAVGLLASRKTTVRRALTFEVGIQNSGLALVILLGQLQGVGGATAIAAVWGVWHLVAGGILVTFMRFRDTRRAPIV